MGFMSLVFMGLFLIMGVAGLFFLLAALILFLVNRHRLKKGKEKKRRYKIAGILCLVLGCFNVAPIVFIFCSSYVSTGMTNAANRIKLAMMPERAVLYRERLNDDETQGTDKENLDEWEDDDDEEDWTLLKYQDKEYLFIPCEPDSSKVKLSKPKAYLEYGTMSSEGEDREGEDDSYPLQEIVYEVENETGFDLLCVLGDFDSILEGIGIGLDGFYCCKDQYEDFLHTARTGAEYYLEQFQEEEENNRRVSAAGFQLTDLGIDATFLDSLDNGQGETLGDYPKNEYELHMIAMDGLFSNYCTTIGKYEGKWYCYSIFAFGKVKDAHLLPEAGQRYMDSLK